HDVHDLVLADGTSSGRLQPGESTTVRAGVITRDLDGWCSIVGHRAMGMTMAIRAVGAPADQEAGAGSSARADELAAVPLDLQAAPGVPPRDARLPESSGASQRLTLEMGEV